MRNFSREEEMDRRIQDQLEEYLHGVGRQDEASSARSAEFQSALATTDEETRNVAQLMEVQARLLRTLRPPADDSEDLAPGFYARVMNRIEEQRPRSIWNYFLEPRFSRRLAFASASLLALLTFAFITSEPAATEAPIQAAVPEHIMAEPEPTPVTAVAQSEGRDVMLRQLTVYSE